MFLSIFMTLAYLGASKHLIPKQVIYAVDCGGYHDVKSSIGVTFRKDQNYSKNVKTDEVDYFAKEGVYNPIVRYTSDTHMYMSERQSEQNFKYFIPMTKNWSPPTINTQFVLILKFAEFFFEESQKRVFNIKIGNQLVVKDLDVFNIVGFSSAYDEYIPLQYRGDGLYFRELRCDGAINENNEIQVEFVKSSYDNPMVSAILLYQGKISDTDYLDIEETRAEWLASHKTLSREEEYYQKKQETEDRKIHIEKKQSILKVRAGFEHEIEIQRDEIEENPQRPHPELSWELAQLMITSPIGIICIIGLLTSTFVLTAFTFFDPYGEKQLLAQIEAGNYPGYVRNDNKRQVTLDSSVSSVSDQNEQIDPQYQQISQRQTTPEPQPIDVTYTKIGKVKVQDSKKRE